MLRPVKQRGTDTKMVHHVLSNFHFLPVEIANPSPVNYFRSISLLNNVNVKPIINEIEPKPKNRKVSRN